MRKLGLIFIILFTFSGCGVVKELTSFSRLQYRLANLESIRLGSVRINNKTTVRDFSSLDILKLSTAFVRGSLPFEFILNVEVKNPNADSKVTSNTDFRISSFPWRLLLNGKQAVQGNISSPVTIPGNKYMSYIKVGVKFNLVNLIKEKGYEGLVNLALNLAHQKSSPALIELFAKPVVETTMGKINYPEEIKIISMNFAN